MSNWCCSHTILCEAQIPWGTCQANHFLFLWVRNLNLRTWLLLCGLSGFFGKMETTISASFILLLILFYYSNFWLNWEICHVCTGNDFSLILGISLVFNVINLKGINGRVWVGGLNSGREIQRNILIHFWCQSQRNIWFTEFSWTQHLC